MGSAINLDEIKRFEVTEVYSHPDAKVDVVLVHGLNGDPRNTWTAKNGVFWPTQLLPATLKSVKARILVYGYNGDVVTFGGKGDSPSSDMLYQHAQSLVTNLAMERASEETTDHPIIFVAHSLGGILVKRALELSNDLTSRHADENRNIFVSTYGIIFLGTPHTGADPAKWGLVLERMVHTLVPRRVMSSESQLVKTLQSNNETLQNINLHFLDILPKFRICMAHEEMETDLRGTKAFIVDQTSASPMLPDVVYFGIANTHSGMCKYESKNSPGYLTVSTTLKTWIQEAPKFIPQRQEFERKLRRQQKEALAAELLGVFPHGGPASGGTPGPSSEYRQALSQLPAPSLRPIFDFETAEVEEVDEIPEQWLIPLSVDAVSMSNSQITIPKEIYNVRPDVENNPSDNEPYFIKPSGFRPNALFVGREPELKDLHRTLMDKKKRALGTVAVLLQCLPGGGKTHLARQYVYDHKDSFPGGIFWLRAKSKYELTAGYWDIARKIVLRKGATSPVAGTGRDEKGDSEVFMKQVKKWFNKHSDWLLVLDGIRFDDLDGMQRFIPDSPRTGLIYTSTEKSATGNHLWMSPSIIAVPSLSAREAQKLLLMKLNRREPFSKDDLKWSMQLVQSMGFLPVVIHMVAQRLKDTGEHLGRFAKSYAADLRLRNLGAYIAVVDQLRLLGAFEALHLMYLLCFFSQHIPVELIHLGLPVLNDQHIQCRTSGTLNDTFRILNMFALIERNAQEYPHELGDGGSGRSGKAENGSRKSSSISSSDILADNIDVIRFHSVVQGFFVDTLLGSREMVHEPILPWIRTPYELWLHRAVQVFCCSYDMAHERITKKTNTGLVEDYRLYEIHGIRLREHALRHKNIPMPETLTMLDLRLNLIKAQIEQRTPESSSVIQRGRPNAFQVSIFDRTSSSSDAGTPSYDLKFHSTVSTWGLPIDEDNVQHESPQSINGNDFRIPLAEHYKGNGRSFSQMPIEDPGYDGDRETAVTTVNQLLQQTVTQSTTSPISPGGPWQVVTRNKPRPLDPWHHRTTKNRENQRYHDSAGSFRAIGTIDPRAIHLKPSLAHEGIMLENVKGEVGTARAVSRGRSSGNSIAELALAHINKNSPPPARGGGIIQGRRSSQTSSRLRSGRPSYAIAVSGSTMNTIPGIRDPDAGSSVYGSPSSVGSPPMRSAMEALGNVPGANQTYTPMPPYPHSPAEEYHQPFGQLYPRAPVVQQSQENGIYDPASNIYPHMLGLLPTTIRKRSTSSPLRWDHSADEYPSDLETGAYHQYKDILSLSSPNILHNPRTSDSDLYIPGHPELSHGYTSQPMSRDPSSQGVAPGEERRASVAETEPLPKLGEFSPKIGPTSYQVYEKMQRQEEQQREQEKAGLKRSPPLRFSQQMDITTPPIPTAVPSRPASEAKRKFNPNAPAFLPSSSSLAGMGAGFDGQLDCQPQPTRTSPGPSLLHNQGPFSPPPQTTYPYPPPQPQFQTRHSRSSRHSPLQNQPPFSPPSSSTHSLPPQPQFQARQSNSPRQAQEPFSPPLQYSNENAQVGSERMKRTGSGGVRIGMQVINFGDVPEGVVVKEARERALRGRNGGTGLGIDGAGLPARGK
ncbi:hypothetical protein B0O99DRAFT_601687 [Bisporella sp. PMI_857]|nr:hypothetical protein B0O99DRAFT_601687 [Bisporella sp. PMI_857]